MKYDFDLSLKGLFIVHTDGNISVYRNPDTDIGPFEFDAKKLRLNLMLLIRSQVVETCQKLQDSDFELNQKYRQQHNLPHRYEYNHFIMEGRVLYLLDEKEQLIKKTMYKVKPRDIEEVTRRFRLILACRCTGPTLMQLFKAVSEKPWKKLC